MSGVTTLPSAASLDWQLPENPLGCEIVDNYLGRAPSSFTHPLRGFKSIEDFNEHTSQFAISPHLGEDGEKDERRVSGASDISTASSTDGSDSGLSRATIPEDAWNLPLTDFFKTHIGEPIEDIKKVVASISEAFNLDLIATIDAHIRKDEPAARARGEELLKYRQGYRTGQQEKTETISAEEAAYLYAALSVLRPLAQTEREIYHKAAAHTKNPASINREKLDLLEKEMAGFEEIIAPGTTWCAAPSQEGLRAAFRDIGSTHYHLIINQNGVDKAYSVSWSQGEFQLVDNIGTAVLHRTFKTSKSLVDFFKDGVCSLLIKNTPSLLKDFFGQVEGNIPNIEDPKFWTNDGFGQRLSHPLHLLIQLCRGGGDDTIDVSEQFIEEKALLREEIVASSQQGTTHSILKALVAGSSEPLEGTFYGEIVFHELLSLLDEASVKLKKVLIKHTDGKIREEDPSPFFERLLLNFKGNLEKDPQFYTQATAALTQYHDLIEGLKNEYSLPKLFSMRPSHQNIDPDMDMMMRTKSALTRAEVGSRYALSIECGLPSKRSSIIEKESDSTGEKSCYRLRIPKISDESIASHDALFETVEELFLRIKQLFGRNFKIDELYGLNDPEPEGFNLIVALSYILPNIASAPFAAVTHLFRSQEPSRTKITIESFKELLEAEIRQLTLIEHKSFDDGYRKGQSFIASRAPSLQEAIIKKLYDLHPPGSAHLTLLQKYFCSYAAAISITPFQRFFGFGMRLIDKDSDEGKRLKLKENSVIPEDGGELARGALLLDEFGNMGKLASTLELMTQKKPSDKAKALVYASIFLEKKAVTEGAIKSQIEVARLLTQKDTLARLSRVAYQIYAGNPESAHSDDFRFWQKIGSADEVKTAVNKHQEPTNNWTEPSIKEIPAFVAQLENEMLKTISPNSKVVPNLTWNRFTDEIQSGGDGVYTLTYTEEHEVLTLAEARAMVAGTLSPKEGRKSHAITLEKRNGRVSRFYDSKMDLLFNSPRLTPFGVTYYLTEMLFENRPILPKELVYFQADT